MNQNNFINHKKVVLVKAPLRISLAGGGTDLKSYSSKFEGAVLGFAIDKYITNVVWPRSFNQKINAYWEYEDAAKDIKDLKNEFGKICLEQIGIKNNSQIATFCDVPSGTGLGGSAAFCISLLGTNEANYLDENIKMDLAEKASLIEIHSLLRSVGKQDHYLSALGGVNLLKFDKNLKVAVSKVKLGANCMRYFENNLLLFYTGIQRSANDILAKQSKNTDKNESIIIESLHIIKSIVNEMLAAIEEDDPSKIGPLIDKHWREKIKLSEDVSGSKFNEIYTQALTRGADGGKILGAGGGGFFLLSVKEGFQESIRTFMQKVGMNELPFKIDFKGVESINLNL